MKIGNWELRKPWVHYVDLPIEQEVYDELRAHFGEVIAKEIETYHPLFTTRKAMQKDWEFAVTHTREVAARIARRQK